MKLGEIISGYRQHKKQSLDALAGEIGIDPIALWRLEQNKFAGFKQWPAVLAWVFGAKK
jgi:transcriptional regulator with XRE-family HTH domain